MGRPRLRRYVPATVSMRKYREFMNSLNKSQLGNVLQQEGLIPPEKQCGMCGTDCKINSKGKDREPVWICRYYMAVYMMNWLT